MFQRKVFVVKVVAIDGAGASAVCIDEIASLAHEVFDDAVEVRVLVPLGDVVGTKLSGAELTEVLRGAGHNVGKELELESPCWRVTDRDVHEHDGSSVGACARNGGGGGGAC